MKFAIEDPSEPEVLVLLQHGEDESAKLYPAESNHHLPLDELRRPDVIFYVGRNAQGQAISTGALKLHDDWAEIKRVWVEPDARGQGISKALLTVLESGARARDLRWLRLETGIESRAALSLYDAAGFQVRAPFANYRPDSLSVFMEKDLFDRDR